MVDIVWKTAKSNRSSKSMNNEVLKSYKADKGKAVFVQQQDAMILSQQDITQHLDANQKPEIGYLYTNGCSPCVGVALTGTDSKGQRVTILSHIDQNSEQGVDAIFADLLNHFEKIAQIHMVSEMGFDPSTNPQYKDYQKLGKEVLSYFESKSSSDIKNATVTASYQADALMVDLNTGKISQSKGVLDATNVINPKIYADTKGKDDTPDWLKSKTIVVAELANEGKSSETQSTSNEPSLNQADPYAQGNDPLNADSKDDVVLSPNDQSDPSNPDPGSNDPTQDAQGSQMPDMPESPLGNSIEQNAQPGME